MPTSGEDGDHADVSVSVVVGVQSSMTKQTFRLSFVRPSAYCIWYPESKTLSKTRDSVGQLSFASLC